MHILKQRLDEIENMTIPEDQTFIPNEMYECGLTCEELGVYLYYCYYKSNGLKLPSLSELAKRVEMKEGLLKITIAALAEKGITFE